MAKFRSSDGWLFATIMSARKNPTLKDIISTGDMLNHSILSLEEINTGLSRLNACGLIRIENKNIIITAEGDLFFSQNNNANEGCIKMQLRFSEIFSKKKIPCAVNYVDYFSIAEHSEAYGKYCKL